MRHLSAADLLTLWENGNDLHSVDQALLVLRYACPEQTSETLIKMSLGQRDTLLLKVRQMVFGDRIEAYTECPHCQERLEFSTSCHALLTETPPHVNRQKLLTIEDKEFILRAPNSIDAAAAASSGTVEEAKQSLVAHCIAQKDFPDMEFAQLPESVQTAIVNEMMAVDPQAEILLDLACPNCGYTWHDVFDIVAFLWTEIRARARRLLQNIDALARVYGWTEADILQMSEARRGMYLRLALS